MSQLMLVNPRKRKAPRRKPAARKKVAVAKRKPAAPVKRVTKRVVRRRRNPIGGKNILSGQITPALTSASGALALDFIWGYAPLPESVKNGSMRYIAKGAGAILMGMLAGNVINKSTAKQLATGALTVVMHDAMRDMAQVAMPGVPLGYYSPGLPMGQYVDGLGEYTSPSSASGYLSDSLSTPFAGSSSAQDAERRVMEECNAGY